ncbi:hypothetical protein [Novosphingobium sp.]|uniref:hypothetical protein n=1 Tax=Novosphingobium sp. TaxID=1874826 RepID=UPI0025F3192F|nr:hypothetical protein [Novosphingobium sp.]
MTNATAIEHGAHTRGWNGWHLAALLAGNVALALGPMWVRLADSGPVSAGFGAWRSPCRSSRCWPGPTASR